MIFVDSRNAKNSADFKQIITEPLASSGGLFCPSDLPKMDAKKLKNLPFFDLAKEIFAAFCGENKHFEDSLKAYLEFDNQTPFEIKKLDEKNYICELFHGKTRAFKDLALAPLARLLKDEKQVIMCATSGDTGPATLSAFSENENTKTICIYPLGKTSLVQAAQMSKVPYKNSLVLAIDGNFDDAQSKLKELLNDSDFKAKIEAKGYKLSAANSLNFGRIMYQLIYHFALSLHFEKAINVIVPSGNFGNALACFYAKKMGANIAKIKIVSNENCVLYDFFTSGIYSIKNREFKCTLSPAMDILKSSNLERLLFYFFGDEATKKWMSELEIEKEFRLNKEQLALLQEYFIAYKCDDETCLKNIKNYSDSYLFDPHTATTLNALEDDFNVICSTAEWCKFAPSICKALDIKMSEKEAIEFLCKKYSSPLRNELKTALDSSEFYAHECSVDEIKNKIMEHL